MVALSAKMAGAERETLSERVKSGLAEAGRKGSKLGRPQNSRDSTNELLVRYPEIVRRLKKG